MKKLALGCAALTAALFAFRWFAGTANAPSDARASTGLSAHATAREEGRTRRPVLEFGAPAAERASLGVSATAAATNASPVVETLFHGRLIDLAGQPLAGAAEPSVNLVDAEGRQHQASALEFGAFAFRALPYGKYRVSTSADGYLGTSDEIELDSAHPELAKDYTLALAPVLKIRVLTPEGANLFDEELDLENRPALAVVATREQPGRWLDQVAGNAGKPFGIGCFLQSGPRVDSLPGGYMGILMLDHALPAFASLVDRQRVLQTQEIRPGDDVVTFVLAPEELGLSLATNRVPLIDPGTLAPFEGPQAWFRGGALADRGLDPDPNARGMLAGRDAEVFDLHTGSEGRPASRTRMPASSSATNLDSTAIESRLEVEVLIVDSSGAARNSTFNLGIYDPLSATLRMPRDLTYVSTGAGELELSGLGHQLYVLRTSEQAPVSIGPGGGATWVSGNVLLDLRSRSAPTSFVVTLTRATRVMLFATSEQFDGLGFRVVDEQDLELESGRFHASGSRALMLPQGDYRIALLDPNDAVLSEQIVRVGTRPLSVDL